LCGLLSAASRWKIRFPNATNRVNSLYNLLLVFPTGHSKSFIIHNLTLDSSHRPRGDSAAYLPSHHVMMNKTDSDRIHELCSLIAAEQDRAKFLDLVGELNRILEVNDQRLKSKEVGH
jgi:hypothetical protein